MTKTLLWSTVLLVLFVGGALAGPTGPGPKHPVANTSTYDRGVRPDASRYERPAVTRPASGSVPFAGHPDSRPNPPAGGRPEVGGPPREAEHAYNTDRDRRYDYGPGRPGGDRPDYGYGGPRPGEYDRGRWTERPPSRPWPTAPPPPPSRPWPVCPPRHYPDYSVVLNFSSRPVTPPLLGAVVVAADNTFLGVVSRDLNDPESIANPYGRYGDPRSPYSIWNAYSPYGARSGNTSAWCEWATRPPKVFYGDYFWGYLSTNRSLSPRINPYWLIDHLGINIW